MQKVSNKLRVSHFPQIPCKPFIVEVKDEEQADWVDYYNEEEGMEFDEFVETYLSIEVGS